MTSSDEIWEQFVASGLVVKSIRLGDTQSAEQAMPKLDGLGYEQSQLQLKRYLNQEAYSRLNARFRKYKQRQLNNQTTITVSDAMLKKIKMFAEHACLDHNNYDLIFEHMLDPEENLDDSKEAVSDMPTSLNIAEESCLLRAKLRLRTSTWRIFLNQIEYAFNMGWLASKYLKGRRTEQAQASASEQFMDKIKSLV